MCITFVAIGHSKSFPLIIVHNRDEFFSRTAHPLHKIDSTAPYDIYGGLDLKSNGMWIGITSTGKVGYITSYRDRSKWSDAAKSRGVLVKAYLEGSLTAPDYLTALSAEVDEFNPFNLVLGTINELYYWNSNQRQVVRVADGCHTLSNAYLDTPWFKTTKLLALMQPLCSDTVTDATIDSASVTPPATTTASYDRLESALMAVLVDAEQAETSQLPSTGLPLDQERAMSSIFIDTPAYGTVSSTVLMVGAAGVVRMVEYSHSAGTGGQSSTRVAAEFTLS